MLADAPFNDLTHEIIAAAIEVHRTLGPGLLESTYQPCLEYELAARGLTFSTQRKVPVSYKELTLDSHYRVDLIVDERVVVEVKAVVDGVKRVINPKLIPREKQNHPR